MSGSRINEQTVVPVTWLFLGLGSVIASTALGVFWIAAVNYRLQRIEMRLGIPPFQTQMEPVRNAFAGSDEVPHAHTK